MADELDYELRGGSHRVHFPFPTEVTVPVPPGTVSILGPLPDVVQKELLVLCVQHIRIATLDY